MNKYGENSYPPPDMRDRPLQVGDKVTISPFHSITFASRHGTVVAIKKDDGLPIMVNFGAEADFGFHPDELIEGR